MEEKIPKRSNKYWFFFALASILLTMLLAGITIYFSSDIFPVKAFIYSCLIIGVLMSLTFYFSIKNVKKLEKQKSKNKFGKWMVVLGVFIIIIFILQWIINDLSGSSYYNLFIGIILIFYGLKKSKEKK